jgi:hypothetical protein
MPPRILNWLRRNRKSAGLVVSIAYGVFLLAAGLLSWHAGKDVSDSAHNLLIGLTISFAVGQLFLFAIAALWFTDYHLAERASKRTVVEIFQSPVDFARKKCAVLHDLDPQSLQNRIYGVSHCNLFAKPEGDSEQEVADVRNLNVRFFSELAHLVMRSNNPDVRYRVLLQYDDADLVPQQDGKDCNLAQELKARQEIFTKAGRSLPSPMDWGREHFAVKRLMGDSDKDYFVINDHIFKTIRQTPGTHRSIYIYIQGQELAKSYWTWLHDLYEYGENDELVEVKETWRIFEETRAKEVAK